SRGGSLPSPTGDDTRPPAAHQRPRAAEDREQDGRAEAREEVAVDLAADAGLPREIGGGRGERDRHAVGPHQPRPHQIGTALPGLGGALIFADEARGPWDEN